jgi:hypothetical protein
MQIWKLEKIRYVNGVETKSSGFIPLIGCRSITQKYFTIRKFNLFHKNKCKKTKKNLRKNNYKN